MNIMGIAIGATGLLLLCMFLWMLALSLRKKRLEQERKEREIAYRKAMEKNRQQEHDERIMKAEGGHVPTILYLAKESERTRPQEAVYWYTKAAKLDNVTGMYGVVRISNKMKQDLVLKEQAKFWQVCISASEGSLPHQFEMAQALFTGRGTEVNLPKGLSVMESAAAQDHINALVFLGDWYIAANNPDKSPSKSTDYYRKAAELRSNEGRMKLGLNYIQGRGVASNFERGIYWLERAAEKGHLDAMYKAGEAWMDQKPNGNALAYIWLFLAGQLGHEPARNLRDQVALNIGVDTVVGLQSLAKPMVKRISDNKVSKHSIIKALNKLYKRSIPTDEHVDALGTVASDNTLQVEAGPPSDEEVKVSEPSGKVDYSQSPMDKQ
ncbi:tetratricopeptide repeat protein [Vibrio tubiashii]|uniref:tetratricopeptide repeat protein n=1 Tax=Vibrio tubiashii TaxID=29498 RepID=UPI00349E8FF9